MWRSLFPAADDEKQQAMRFGSRKDDDGRAQEVVPASRSAVEVAQQPVIPSKRLQRVAEHFHTQAELLATMRQEFESEMEPMHELLVQQANTMQRLLTNLEERLRPLNEYADGEEANLDALEHRMNESGSDQVARSFADYLAEQRGRIAGTRQQIDQQRMPFLQYGEEQRDTVEVALSRFDSDMDALEQTLAEQRKVMLRMLDAMRSETFSAVKEFLMSRQEALGALATSGSTDPTEIGRSVQSLRRALEPMADAPQVKPVLERVDQADRRLVASAPSNPRPRMVPPSESMRDLSPDEDTDEATA